MDYNTLSERRAVLTLNIPKILLFILLITVFWCRYKSPSFMGGIILIAEMIIGIFLWVGNKEVDNRKYGRKSWIFKIQVIFLLYKIIVAAVFGSSFFDSTKKIFMYEVGTLFVVYYLIPRLGIADTIDCIKKIGIINILIGLQEYISKTSRFAMLINDESRVSTISFGSNAFRVRTMFIHPIICAAFLIVIYCTLHYFPLKKKLLDIFVKMALLLCILGTQSRSSWVALFIIFVIFVLEKIIRRSTKIRIEVVVAIIISILAFLVLTIVYGDKIREIFMLVIDRWNTGMNKNDVSNYTRMAMIRMGLKNYINRPLINMVFGSGNGYALGLLAKNAIRGWSLAVDNTFITVLLDYGIIGLFSIIYFIIISLVNILKKNRVNKLAGAALLSIYISGFFYDLYYWFTTDMLISVMICLIAYEDTNMGINYEKQLSSEVS